MIKLFFNAEIYTMDDAIPKADALVIEGDKIKFVGIEIDARDLLKKTDFEEFNMEGKTILPGFYDGHAHLLMYGHTLLGIDLRNVNSVDELIETTRKYLKNHNDDSDSDWIEGSGWNEERFPDKKMPTRHDLDKISTTQPIVLNRICENLSVLNTKALELIAIDKHIDTPLVGGVIDVDESGSPTGILKGNSALKLWWDTIPNLNKEQIKKRITVASKECIKYGVTSIQTDDFLLIRAGGFKEILEAYFELDKESKLLLKFNQMLYLPSKELLEEFLALGYKTGDGSHYFKIGPFKLPTDGTLGAKTATLNEPYEGDDDNYGFLYMTPAEITGLARTAHENGLQVVMDGIGETAMETVIEAYRQILENDNRDNKELRLGIDHCQLTSKKIIEDFSKYDLIAGLEFQFLSSDIPIVEDRIGKKRAKWSYNARTFLDNNVILTAGSDIPVETPNPLMGIYSVVNRKTFDGFPEGGWFPEQKLTVKEAVYAYTMGSAYSCFDEKIKGSITKGKYADLVVLCEDIFQLSPEKIKDVSVKATIIDGEVVYGII